MANEGRPRWRTPRVGKRELAKVGHYPRWFLRHAVARFGLNVFDIAVFMVIADNMDEQGASRTAVKLIHERTGMNRDTARKSIDVLLQCQIIFELDARRNGVSMRYAIATEAPL